MEFLDFKLKLALIYSFFAFQLFYCPWIYADTTKTICTITINSDDEKNVFTKHLQSETHHKYNFIELVTEQEDWFTQACQSGIQCDVLLISGHFAGQFFGNSGKTLSLKELEKNSCSSSCRGILSHPTEVFLFGCNTLANKSADHRTPNEYLAVLLNDGISRHTAEQVVAARYSSAYGSSTRDRMQRIFEGVSKIYGFDSVAPIGNRIAPFLKKYFQSIPDYMTHLERLSVEAALKLAESKLTLISPQIDACTECTSQQVPSNEILKHTLGHLNIEETSGALSETRTQVCELLDPSQSIKKRSDLLLELITRSDGMAYLPILSEFIKEHPIETWPESIRKPFLRDMSENTKIQKIIASLEPLYTNTTLPYLSAELNFLGQQLQWLTQKSYLKNLESITKHLYNNPEHLSLESKDIICGIDPYLPSDRTTLIPYSEIESIKWNDNLLEATACLHPNDLRIQKQLILELSNSSEFRKVKAALALSANLNSKSVGLIAPLILFLNDTPVTSLSRSAHLHILEAFQQNPILNSDDSNIEHAVAEKLDEPSLRLLALETLKSIKTISSATQNRIAALLDDSSSFVQQHSLETLEVTKPNSIKIQEAIVMKLSSQDPFVKKAAYWTLVAIRPTQPKILFQIQSKNLELYTKITSPIDSR